MPKKETNVPQLKNSIANYRLFLKQAVNFQNTLLENANLQTCQYYLKFLNDGYFEFLANQEAFELSEQDEKVDHEATRTEIGDVFFSCAPAIETRIEELRTARAIVDEPANKNTSPQVCPKLPEITLDIFTGEQMTKWPEFLAQFDGLVHTNPNLNVISKFQYLRGSLSGAARNIIENLPVTAENYEDARQMLIAEYNNPKRICEQHIKALFTYKPLDKACPKRLSELLSHYNSHVRSLTNQNRPTCQWDDLLVYLISSKFDQDTRMKWIESAPSSRLATLADITSFIRTRCNRLGTQLESFQSRSSHHSKSSTPANSGFTHHKTFASALHASSSKSFMCYHCKTPGHSIMRCTTFKSYSIDQRRNFILEERLCFNCMHPNHSSNSCPVKDRCHVCQRKHHTMLHRDTGTDNEQHSFTSSCNQVTSNHASSEFCQGTSLQTTSSTNHVLLATALIDVYDQFGTPFKARALLDSGSQVNFVTQALVKRLGLQINLNNSDIFGIGGSLTSSTSSTILRFHSKTSSYSSTIDCSILPQITTNQPSFKLQKTQFDIPNNIKLADPNFYESNQIDLLIGASHFFELISVGQIKLANQTVLQNTQLGWVVSGQIMGTINTNNCLSLHATTTSFDESIIEKSEDLIPDKSSSQLQRNRNKQLASTYRHRDEESNFVTRQTLDGSSLITKKHCLQRDKSFDHLLMDLLLLFKDSGPLNNNLPHQCVFKQLQN